MTSGGRGRIDRVSLPAAAYITRVRCIEVGMDDPTAPARTPSQDTASQPPEEGSA